jgi:anti-sigma factor RsiW
VAAALLVLVVVGAWHAAHPVVTVTDLDWLVGAHHQETLGPNPVALASSDPDVITAWTRRQTGHVIQPPAFDADGYRLLGARAAASLDATAVSFVYEGPEGRLTCTILAGRRTVYPGFAPAAASPLVHVTSRQGASVAMWWDDASTYLMVGDIPPAVLQHLADVAEQQD